mmetsp:Transcript_4606/g.5095  ORF Transcript_4606/g.5095 Transcript_4606/m.5095 type:complete len:92 (-) Transcript_4606:17-292(-)
MTAINDEEVNRLLHQKIITKNQKVEMMRKNPTMIVSDEEEVSRFLPLHQTHREEIIAKKTEKDRLSRRQRSESFSSGASKEEKNDKQRRSE